MEFRRKPRFDAVIERLNGKQWLGGMMRGRGGPNYVKNKCVYTETVVRPLCCLCTLYSIPRGQLRINSHMPAEPHNFIFYCAKQYRKLLISLREEKTRLHSLYPRMQECRWAYIAPPMPPLAPLHLQTNPNHVTGTVSRFVPTPVSLPRHQNTCAYYALWHNCKLLSRNTQVFMTTPLLVSSMGSPPHLHVPLGLRTWAWGCPWWRAGWARCAWRTPPWWRVDPETPHRCPSAAHRIPSTSASAIHPAFFRQQHKSVKKNR